MPSRKSRPKSSQNKVASGKSSGRKGLATKQASVISGNASKQPKRSDLPKRSLMGPRPRSGARTARNVENYEHPKQTRLNNPPVGLVTPETDPSLPTKSYAYDPHLDPQLIWTGKAEKSALELDTVSLHVHERIDPYTIMDSVRTKESFIAQPSLFEQPHKTPPLRVALDFYKHQHEWSNRLIAGDSALVMNSLLEKEGMAGRV